MPATLSRSSGPRTGPLHRQGLAYLGEHVGRSVLVLRQVRAGRLFADDQHGGDAVVAQLLEDQGKQVHILYLVFQSHLRNVLHRGNVIRKMLAELHNAGFVDGQLEDRNPVRLPAREGLQDTLFSRHRLVPPQTSVHV